MIALKNKEKVFGKNRFVFAITNHPILGFLIDAYVVQENIKGLFGYDFQKINKRTYHDFFADMSDAEKQGLDITEQYSDEILQKRFCREKIRVKDFIDTLNSDFVQSHIRPYIDRNLCKLAELLAENNIPVYYKGAANDRILENEVRITKSLVNPLFRFEKMQDHTLYSLKLYNDEKLISILESGAELIAVNPCLLFLDNIVYRFEDDWDGKKLIPFFNKENIVIPKASEKIYFEKFVLKAVKNYPVEAVGFDIEQQKKNASPVIKIENSLSGAVVAALYFNYGTIAAFAYKDKTHNYTFLSKEGDSYKFFKVIRDINREDEYAQILTNAGLKNMSALHFKTDTDKGESNYKAKNDHLPILDWIINNRNLLDSKGFSIIQDFSSNKYLTIKPVLNIDVKDKQDWFDLKMIVEFGNYSIPFIKLRDNILKGEREFVLPDGETALLPKEWFARFKDIMRFSTKGNEILHLKRHHYSLLTNLDNGRSFSKLVGNIKVSQEKPIPEMLEANLRHYQVEGYHWLNFLYNNGFGGVLADDMGLGKTLQAITMLTNIYCVENENEFTEELLNSSSACENKQKSAAQLDFFSTTERMKIAPSLIVMPLSLVHNWTKEIMRFSPSLKVHQHFGSNRSPSAVVFDKYDIILTTYGTVRNDIAFLKDYSFHYVILDESQIIKNTGSKIFNSVKQLNAKHRLVLTGTPVENTLTDLWSQFAFLNPGMLGSLNFFKEEYVNPIEKEKNVIKKEKLQRIINPFILRRTKDEVEKELPELTEMMHYCEMTDDQRSVYEIRKSQVRNFIIDRISESGIDKSRFHILSGLMSLRLMANHPKLTDPEYEMSSGKYIEIVRSIEKLLSENHKVLIFSQFVKHLNLIKDYLDKEKLHYSLLTGNTPEKERKYLINEFQTNPDNKLFLISLKAGGVGLNLTGADYVFLLDPWWNPAVENQAINRAHRIGQHKKVFVYKFITRDTVEEKIMNLQQQKSELAGMIINSNNPLKALRLEQLEGLL